jgi:hypothetical protein
MPLYYIAFRLADDADYPKRWESVVQKVREEAAGSLWEEPTSGFLLRSEKPTQALCDSIYLGATIFENRDHLLVINLSSKEYAERGAKYPALLGSLMSSR